MDISGMGGMDMGPNMFQSTNMALARDFWYMVTGVLGLLFIIRLVNFYKAQIRLTRRASASIRFPTKPSNTFLELWATFTTIVREASYPQFHVTSAYFEWMTPPPTGRIVILLCYWAMIIYMASWKVVNHDAYFWERIGFRNAWITITQLPLLYLLASKCSILGIFVGSSHERLNWLHRWVGRTMLATSTLHGWHFYREWALADFVQLEMRAMPMVRWGFGAWGLLVWSLVASFAPFRRFSYELFVTQHVFTSVLFLWVVYVHAPSYARYNVWFAVAALCFDRIVRTLLLVRNVRLRRNPPHGRGGRLIGHEAQVSAVGQSITILTIKYVHFKWRAGQFIYLWIPRVGLTETHPYTVACAHQENETTPCNDIYLVVRKHSGFSRRLHQFARRAAGHQETSFVTAFVSGPYGVPPRWSIFESLVLIAASTGASFTLPILESVMQNSKASCTRHVDFILTARLEEEIEFYEARLQELVRRAPEVGVNLRVCVAVTRDPKVSSSVSTLSARKVMAGQFQEGFMAEKPPSSNQHDAAIVGVANPMPPPPPLPSRDRTHISSSRCGGSDIEVGLLRRSTRRPDVEAWIRRTVEATGGETSVVVCGGPGLVTRIRNYVASLSDERAVHKGSGAQGIHLHVEEYNF